ncbi:MAG: HNH endonuclease, partial [Clostridia bacterium]|nr:HNH endonuclease [Clostridia bacterium]
MEEIWKNIDGFDGAYQISNLGRVKSVERIKEYIGRNQTGCEFIVRKYCPEKILKTYLRGGYEHVGLKIGSQSFNYSVHRIVATYFIPNPDNLPVINHKDENKLNNVFTNLEWCTVEYNANYGTRNQRIAEKLMENPNYYIPVLCYDLKNNFVKRYESAVAAGKELGLSSSGITACCRLSYNRTSAGGY